MKRVGAGGWYRIVGLTWSIAVSSVPTAAAQAGASGLHPGDVIRVQRMDGRAKWVAGAVVGGNSDSIRFVAARSTDTTAVALADLRRWEVSRGTRRRTGRGALHGLFYGAFTSGLAAMMVPAPEASGMSAGGFYGVVAAAGGVLGAGVGALIGSRQRTHRWEPVARPWRAEPVGHASEDVRRAGLGIAVSF